MKNEVTHKNIIKGLLKEALFLDLECQITFSKSIIHGRIVELSDSESEAMMLYLDLDETLPSKLPSNANISIFFKNFMARFEVEIAFWRLPFLMLRFPKILSLTNDRAETRHLLGDDASGWTRVALDNGMSHTVAQFRPTNLSQNGLGGELIFSSRYELHPGTAISGDHWFNGQWLKIHGIIRSLRQLTPAHDETNFCIIGVENPGKYTIRSSSNQSRAHRSAAKMELEFFFLANESKRFRIQIKNVSVSGFLAEIEDVEIQNLALTSKLASRLNSSMQSQLVSYDGTSFRFQWIAGNEADRLKWLKEISTFIGPDIDAQSLRKDDILSLFCQSGALSDAYIKEQKALSREMLKALGKGSFQEPWIFRWTNRASTGKAKGYVSAIKSGDNTWSVIDIVSDRYGEKISKGFMANFFTSFADFSLSLTPCPLHFIGWVKDHPFFSDFEKYMHSEGQSLVIGKCEMLYTRLKKDVLPSNVSIFSKKKINGTDYHEILRIQNLLTQFGLKEFSDAMDFSPSAFSSPSLAQLFGSNQHPFKREYWTFQNEGASFFCIFTLIPEGQNPGRWVDSIYVLDINVGISSEKFWTDLKQEIIRHASELGYSTHAIRRLAKIGQTSKYSEEVAHLSAFVLHPAIWKYFNVTKS